MFQILKTLFGIGLLVGVFRVVDVKYNYRFIYFSFYILSQLSLDPSEEDIFLGAGSMVQFGESFRLYVDKSVIPHTVAIDSRVRNVSAESLY